MVFGGFGLPKVHTLYTLWKGRFSMCALVLWVEVFMALFTRVSLFEWIYQFMLWPCRETFNWWMKKMNSKYIHWCITAASQNIVALWCHLDIQNTQACFRKCFKSILCDILKGSRGAHVYISLAKHLLTCVFGLRAGVCLPNLIRVRSGVNVSS